MQPTPIETHANALPPGTRIDRYRIDGVLGHGGFGITYLGFDETLLKKVAIKECLPVDICTRTASATIAPISSNHRTDFEWALKRFIEEAQILARFEHPGIVRVSDVFQANGTAYMVTQLLEGCSFEEWLRRQPAPVEETVLRRMLLALLDALAAIHAKNVLHRDIKPENIQIDHDGKPTLLDFGSARHAVTNRSRPVTAVVSPGYAPFEQYYDGGIQGPCTDLYALGAVFHRVITGKPPPEATKRERHDPYEPLARTHQGRYTRSLLDAIDCMLRQNETHRPQTVAEVLALLDQQQKPKPATQNPRRTTITPPPENSPEEPAPGRSARPRGVQIALVSGALMAACAAVAFIVFGLINKSSPQPPPPNNGGSGKITKLDDPPPPPPTLYDVAINTKPGAKITLAYANGNPAPVICESEPQGRWRASSLRQGEYRVTASLAGHYAGEKTFSVPATAAIHLSPRAKPAVWRITSQPSGAAILLDGRSTGNRTPSSVELDDFSKRRQVDIELEGYRKRSPKHALPEPGQQISIDFGQLILLPKIRLNIYNYNIANMAALSVFISGTKREPLIEGHTLVLSGDWLADGKYQIDLACPGYEPSHLEIVISEETPQPEKNITLVKIQAPPPQKPVSEESYTPHVSPSAKNFTITFVPGIYGAPGNFFSLKIMKTDGTVLIDIQNYKIGTPVNFPWGEGTYKVEAGKSGSGAYMTLRGTINVQYDGMSIKLNFKYSG